MKRDLILVNNREIFYLYSEIVYHLFYSFNLELKLDGFEFNFQNIWLFKIAAFLTNSLSVLATNVCDIGHVLPVDVLCILETFI